MKCIPYNSFLVFDTSVNWKKKGGCRILSAWANSAPGKLISKGKLHNFLKRILHRNGQLLIVFDRQRYQRVIGYLYYCVAFTLRQIMRHKMVSCFLKNIFLLFKRLRHISSRNTLCVNSPFRIKAKVDVDLILWFYCRSKMTLTSVLIFILKRWGIYWSPGCLCGMPPFE